MADDVEEGGRPAMVTREVMGPSWRLGRENGTPVDQPGKASVQLRDAGRAVSPTIFSI